MATNFTVNGKAASTNAPPETPLLWVIREDLKLTGTKFGCGTGLCGACMVHIEGKRAFSCQTQVSEITGKSVNCRRTRAIHCRRHGWRNGCRSVAIASPARS